ncbi:hypothetical protein R1sor_018061 [Riccia sorocarpa]|uniref:Uncharacterized protein n=1 Tax=Riccia sorocarpa TaxID=122646 RepID=A0ABD3IEV2_9MARC
MDSLVQVTFEGHDSEFIPCANGFATVDENFCIARWKLRPKSIHISEQASYEGEAKSFLISKTSLGVWTLEEGKRYKVFSISLSTIDERSNTPDGTPGCSTIDVERATVDEGASSSVRCVSWPRIPTDPRMVSSFYALQQIRGRSELSKLDLASFKHSLVLQLPDNYNGDIVFELPPKTFEDVLKKGGGLEGMDRAHDCWIWTKCTTTSADIPIVLNGDIRTTTVKQKLPYLIAISKEDTHRPDKVAKTQQAFRLHRGSLRFGSELDAPAVEPLTVAHERTPSRHPNSVTADKTIRAEPATLAGSRVVNRDGYLNSDVAKDMPVGSEAATLAGSRFVNLEGHLNSNVAGVQPATPAGHKVVNPTGQNNTSVPVEITPGLQPATPAVNAAPENHRANLPHAHSNVTPEIVHLPDDPDNHIETTGVMP